MAAFTNDGSIPYGSKVLTIGAVAYIADDINVSRPSKKISRTNQIDEPAGSVNYDDFATFTATLQLATTSTVPPAKGATCTVTFDATTGSETWFVFDRTEPFQKDQETKVQVTMHNDYAA
jgi:hypothetical protein